MSSAQRNCPNCGYSVAVEASVCGNCGALIGRPLATRLAPSRTGRLAILAVAALGVGGFFAFRETVPAILKDAWEAVEEELGTPEFETPVIETPVIEGRIALGYRRVRPLVADLNAGGLKCNRIQVDSSDDFLEAGSCQSRGTHVQINVYLRPESIEFAETEIFSKESPFTFLHKDNWWIISSRSVVRAARGILGGEIGRPRD